MALVKCKECGELVSTTAAACPKCGAKPQQGVSLGTIVKWGFLALFAFWVYSCARIANEAPSPSASSTPQPSAPAYARSAPAYSVEMVSFQCERRYTTNIAKATVRNTGTTTIPYAKLFVEFLDGSGKVVAAEDSYFSPTDIPPGATASADVYNRAGSAGSCRPSAIQDGDGNPVNVSVQE